MFSFKLFWKDSHFVGPGSGPLHIFPPQQKIIVMIQNATFPYIVLSFFVTHWPIKLLVVICACAGAHAINYFVIRWASTICFLIYTLLPFTTKATRQKRKFEMRSRFRFILKSPNIGEIRVFPEHYIFKELFFQLGRTKESIKLSLFYFLTYALLTFNTTKSSRRKKIHRHFWKYHWIKSP